MTTTEYKIGGMQQDIRATSEMSAGTLEKIKHDAMAQVINVREEKSRLETSAQEEAKLQSHGSEARVYGDMAGEALMPGSKVYSALVGFLGDRLEDKGIDVSGKDTNTLGIVSPHARTIEEDIGQVHKAPGLYRASISQSVYGDESASAQNFSAKSKITDQSLGATIGERSALASMSLEGQGKDAIKTWGIEEKSGKLSHVKYAKELTSTYDIANEAALNSVKVAEAEHGAMKYKAMQMAPGLSMANGPSFNPSKVLQEAEELWKQGAV